MEFPDDWTAFIHQYEFADKEEVYTNGSIIIPSFRVGQMVEHYFGGGECELVETDSYRSSYETVHVMECSACGQTCEHVNGAYNYCPNCGKKVME